MKLLVALCSYQNPSGLIASIKNLHDLAERRDELSFNIGLDHDDLDGQDVLKYLPTEIYNKIKVTLFPDDIAQSDLWNVLCVPDTAAYYYLSTDDAFCLVQGWDTYLERRERLPHIVFWNDVNLPGAASTFIMSNDWLKATGYALPPFFPYWFADTWVDELRAFVTGEESGVDRGLKISYPPGKTTGLIELDFWWGFFNATRPLRIKKAYQIFSKLYGVDLDTNAFYSRAANLLVDMRRRDFQHKQIIPEMEAEMAEPGNKKIARHLKCKVIALELMEKEGLKLWGDL